MRSIAVSFCLLFAAVAVSAQTPETPQAHYDRVRAAIIAEPSLRLSDPGGLAYYADANAALPAPKPGDAPRVVFFGDSITHNWDNPHYSDLFQRKTNYINRGIGGQTTGGMLLRYRADVLALQPKVVVFQGGSNDLASYKLPDVVGFIEGNIASIVEIAQANGERIILGSMLPVSDAIQPQTAKRPPEKILAINAWMKQYAAEKHVPYVDFYSVLTDGHDRMQTALTIEGLHPNKDGMAKMTALVEPVIAAELARKPLHGTDGSR
jgi:lysophospholipase L1-like esterase